MVTVETLDGQQFKFATPFQPCPYALGEEMTVTFEKSVSATEKDALVEAAVLEETLQTLKRSLSAERYAELIEELNNV